MADPRTTSTITAEFQHEFEAETSALLRRRFLWFVGLVGALHLVLAAGETSKLLRAISAGDAWTGPPVRGLSAAALVSLIVAAVFAAALFRVRRGGVDRRALLSLTIWLVVFQGALNIMGAYMLADDTFSVLAPMRRIAGAHFLACLFLPWTVGQAVRPLALLVVLNALALVVRPGVGWGMTLLVTAISPLAGVPGILLCAARTSHRFSRFKLGALQKRYGEMRRELVDARRIHEALFPAPIHAGPLRFRYVYEPMRQIGGDYLFARSRPGVIDLVVIDVTGHGIPAALTVNRLHGELERLFAEDPGISPGGVLSALNRYVHLTLASHSVYVTALCVRARLADDSLEYASGGHPPAFLRGVDGSIEQLGSTSFVLGACAAPDFDPQPRTVRFCEGDALIAYTDGATEARDARGRMLGVTGLQRVIFAGSPDPDAGWPRTILAAVEQWRHGPPGDDTLVIELARPVGAVRRGAGDVPARDGIREPAPAAPQPATP